MKSKTLVIATRNQHKTVEIAAALAGKFQVKSLADYPDLPEIAETADSFLGNATLKAVEISKLIPEHVLADDSGLEVDALQGAPGVYSARYAGFKANDAANNKKVLDELEKIGALQPAQRRARFVCVLVLARAGKIEAHFTGTCSGTLLTKPQGKNGFGYDPLFVPDGHDKSFGELGPEIKAVLSHRAKAIHSFVQSLKAAS